jgi:hypothetical protein
VPLCFRRRPPSEQIRTSSLLFELTNHHRSEVAAFAVERVVSFLAQVDEKRKLEAAEYRGPMSGL